jgi:hypothetical protein
MFIAAFAAVAMACVFAAPAAQAGCGVLGLNLLCPQPPPPPPPPPPPDPGGSESPDQPVPVPGKGFGFNLGYKPSGDPNAYTSVTAMTNLGINLLRDVIGWNALAGTAPSMPVTPEMSAPLGSLPASSSVAHWDQEYSDLTRHGITPVFILQSVPLWASTLHRCQDFVYTFFHSSECPSGWQNEMQYPDPQYYPQWQTWVRAVAQRYPKAVIEGPNEPDYYSDRYRPGSVGPWTAGDIQCQLFQAVRSVDHRTVLSVGLSNMNYAQTFINHAKGCYDGFSLHPYPMDGYFGVGSGLAAEFASLRSARSAAGDTVPIWVTETGYSLASSGSSPADASQQADADALRRLYNRLMTMPDVNAVMFHTLRDNPIGLDDHFGFFDTSWAPKARACQFVLKHGGSWPGC